MKNLKLNKIKLTGVFLILFVSFLSVSCADDILDKEPVTEITPDTIDTEDGVIRVVNAAYDPLQWKLEGPAETFQQMFQSVRADDLHSQQANFWGRWGHIDQFLHYITNQSVAELWRKLYTGVGRANFAMELAQEFDGFITDGLKERIIAEAKFLRGFYYFELVKHFGDVPLFLEAIRTTRMILLYMERSSCSYCYMLK